jgi:hypothetical protein
MPPSPCPISRVLKRPLLGDGVTIGAACATVFCEPENPFFQCSVLLILILVIAVDVGDGPGGKRPRMNYNKEAFDIDMVRKMIGVLHEKEN